MRLTSFLPLIFLPFTISTPAPNPAPVAAAQPSIDFTPLLDPRQLASTNPTQDITELVKLATALNKFLTGDNIDRLNRIINNTDLLLNPQNLINIDIAIDGGASLLDKDIVAKIIALIEVILSFLSPDFVSGTHTMVPLVNKALPLFGKSMGINLPV